MHVVHCLGATRGIRHCEARPCSRCGSASDVQLLPEQIRVLLDHGKGFTLSNEVRQLLPQVLDKAVEVLLHLVLEASPSCLSGLEGLDLKSDLEQLLADELALVLLDDHFAELRGTHLRIQMALLVHDDPQSRVHAVQLLLCSRIPLLLLTDQPIELLLELSGGPFIAEGSLLGDALLELVYPGVYLLNREIE